MTDYVPRQTGWLNISCVSRCVGECRPIHSRQKGIETADCPTNSLIVCRTYVHSRIDDRHLVFFSSVPVLFSALLHCLTCRFCLQAGTHKHIFLFEQKKQKPWVLLQCEMRGGQKRKKTKKSLNVCRASFLQLQLSLRSNSGMILDSIPTQAVHVIVANVCFQWADRRLTTDTALRLAVISSYPQYLESFHFWNGAWEVMWYPQALNNRKGKGEILLRSIFKYRIRQNNCLLVFVFLCVERMVTLFYFCSKYQAHPWKPN